VKKKRVREKWWLNSEQKNPQKFSQSSQKMAKEKKKKREKARRFLAVPSIRILK
jgi:hypothetical protein